MEKLKVIFANVFLLVCIICDVIFGGIQEFLETSVMKANTLKATKLSNYSISFSKSVTSPRKNLKSITQISQKQSIYKRSFLKNITLLNWLCIPPRKNIPGSNIDKCRQPMQTLVLYNANMNYTTTLHSIKLKFRTGQVSNNFKLLSNHTMIVNGYLELHYPFNIFHYIVQYYVPFHYLVDVWNSSKLTEHAHMYFPKALDDKCVGRPFGGFFLSALQPREETRQYHYNYNSHTGGVCYRYGLLSDSLHAKYSAKAMNHLVSHYGMDKALCPKDQILLSQRSSSRVWTNILENKKVLAEAGYPNVKIVNFGKIPLKEQLQVAYSSRIFVAVHSAELQWAFFMQPDSTAIEIAWPQYSWPFFYTTIKSPSFKNVPIVFYRLETKNVTRLKESIRIQAQYAHMRIPGNVTTADIMKKYSHMKLGKQCHFSVDPLKLFELVKQALPRNKTS